MTDTKLLTCFLDDVKSQVEGVRIFRRVPHRYPFDSVAAELTTKAMSIGRAVVTLLDAGFDDEAYGLSRSIVECALTLRYITADNNHLGERTMQFARQGKKDREFWLYLSQSQPMSDEQKREIESLAEMRGYMPDGKSVHSHWSGERQFITKASNLSHPLDSKDMDSEYLRIARAADYYHPSCFVHCSQPGLDSKIDVEEPYFVVSTTVTSEIDTGRRASVIVFQYVKQVVQFALYGMNVTLQTPLTCITDYMYSDVTNEYAFVVTR